MRGLCRVAGVILLLTLIHPPAKVLGATLPNPATANVSWNANPETDIASYQVNYGTTSGSHPNLIQAGASTAATVTGLVEGTTYYFVVSATNQAGLQSAPSSEVSYQPPVTTVTVGGVIPHTGWSLLYVDSAETNGYPATNAFDGNTGTFWHSNFTSSTATLLPHEIQIDLGSVQSLQGFHYLPRQDNFMTGNVLQYEFYTSMDGVAWATPAVSGVFDNTKTEKEALFTSVNARYVRFRAITGVDGDCAVAELNFLQGQPVVVPVNHAPVAVAQSLSSVAGTSLAMLLSATDVDGNALTYAVVTQPANGTLSGTAPNVTYTPAASFSGADSFTFKANDGMLDSAVATVSLTVTPVAPVVLIAHAGWSLLYVDSAETNGYPATNAFDGKSNTFWHSNFTSSTATLLPHEVQIDLGSVQSLQGFHYLPRQDNFMTGNVLQYEFYTSMDGVAWGTPAVSGVFDNTKTEKEALFTSVNARYVRFRAITGVDGDCAVAELNFLQGQPVVVPPVNHAPVAVAQSLSTAAGTPLAMVLSATDVDGNALTYAVVTQPANGTLSGSAPRMTYTPAASFSGADSFTFKANDGMLDSAVATVSLTVTPVNHAPTFTVNSLNLNATVGTAVTGQLVAVDVDAGAQLTYSRVSGPAWLSIAANGAFSGTPLSANAGANAFVVGVSDGIAPMVTAALNITVANVNHAPVFTLNPILTPNAYEGVAYTGQSLAGKATDVDAGDVISYSKVSGAAWVSVAADGTLSGTPPAGSAGLNTFVVRATDRAAATADAQLQINVVGTLPLPWVTDLIGTGQLAGSAVYAAGSFTQAGAGLFGGTSDTLRFTYQTLSGDGEIIAKVSALQNTGTASRVGVMIRDSLAANAKQAFIGLTGTNAYRWVIRSSTGGKASTSNSSTGTVPNTWVRLVRAGNTITAYRSTNGTSWTSVSITSITMAANCYIGLAVASGSNTVLNTSQFSNVSVIP